MFSFFCRLCTHTCFAHIKERKHCDLRVSIKYHAQELCSQNPFGHWNDWSKNKKTTTFIQVEGTKCAVFCIHMNSTDIFFTCPLLSGRECNKRDLTTSQHSSLHTGTRHSLKVWCAMENPSKSRAGTETSAWSFGSASLGRVFPEPQKNCRKSSVCHISFIYLVINLFVY